MYWAGKHLVDNLVIHVDYLFFLVRLHLFPLPVILALPHSHIIVFSPFKCPHLGTAKEVTASTVNPLAMYHVGWGTAAMCQKGPALLWCICAVTASTDNVGRGCSGDVPKMDRASMVHMRSFVH